MPKWMLVLLTLVLSRVALAVPTEMAHQGRVFDADGQPLAGQHDMVFRLYDDLEGGDPVWSEERTVDFVQGFYAVQLGDLQTSAPLDDQVFAGGTMYLEVELDGVVFTPRQRIGSVPYAQRAATADSVHGSVDADNVAVGGSEVIDQDGNWVGGSVDYGDLVNVPDDADTMDSLGVSCESGDAPIWDGLGWSCAVPPEAVHAQTADNATSADNATHADSATTATKADRADSATTAASADEATHAASADQATHAGSADSATSAQTAAVASAVDPNTDLSVATVSIGSQEVIDAQGRWVGGGVVRSFSDLSDAATIALELVPAHAVLPFDLAQCPPGWQEYTPAYGRMVRGIDRSGQGIDPSGERAAGSLQGDMVGNHTHSVIEMIPNNNIDGVDSATTHSDEHHNETRQTGACCGPETRSKNVALLYCEKL